MRRNSNNGFTTIELIITLSIMSILAGTILFRSANFTALVSENNLVQRIALEVKRAQTAAISGLYPALNTELNQSAPDALWIPSYGVHFSTDPTDDHNKKFAFFFDRDISHAPPNLDFPSQDSTPYEYYDFAIPFLGGCGSGVSECLDTLTIPTGEVIGALYVKQGQNPVQAVDVLDVVYKRPFPDPVITTIDNGALPVYYTDVSAEVVIFPKTTDLPKKSIIISPTGQISTHRVPDNANCYLCTL